MDTAPNQQVLLAKVYRDIDALLAFAKQHLELPAKDEILVRNQIFALFGLDSYQALDVNLATENSCGCDCAEKSATQLESAEVSAQIALLVQQLREDIVAAGLSAPEDGPAVADTVTGFLTLRPAQIQARFMQILEAEGGMVAAKWFFRYCQANFYVRSHQLAENPRFTADNGLIITINLAKPEFRDMKKAAAGNSVAGGYPKCTICPDNEGFAGRDKRNLRTIDITLDGQEWFWQYSPYGYFDQHGICVNYEHTPMHIDRGTFARLMDFVDVFPGYFLGSNAALPRIGGSVLAHDHYQGGGEVLPMLQAAAWQTYKHAEFPQAVVEILDWPGTAVRVVSPDREEILELSDRIRIAWEAYNAPEIDIVPVSEEGKHSVVSPTVIRTTRGYEMSLIFRNNMVSQKYPQGIFHAHPEFHAIKQESIGLIEAQGLFILPGRLVDELGKIEAALVAGADLPAELAEFQLVWDELVETLDGQREPAVVAEAIKAELASVCFRILENTAVFKDRSLTDKFLLDLGCVRN